MELRKMFPLEKKREGRGLSCWGTRAWCLLMLFLMAAFTAQAQIDKKIRMEVENESLSTVFKKLGEASSYKINFNMEDMQSYRASFSTGNGMTVVEIMELLRKEFPIRYKVHKEFISVTKTHSSSSKSDGKRLVSGFVYDEQRSPLPGVNVRVKGELTGSVTSVDGSYQLSVPIERSTTLIFVYIGMEQQEVTLPAGNQALTKNIVLKEDSRKLDDVVVTGIYSRKKESFTGSSQTYKGEELKNIGNQNLIQSLKTLDPAFVVLESNQYGSDPNHLPDLEIRGKSSIVGLKEEFGQDPNQPLFILDGFETTLQTIVDLSIDRIASVTVLKDAASTAIYGAKAANGVVVVETKTPNFGKLNLTYNGSFDVSFADLTDYNLMNAAEKLEYERLAGNFSSNLVDYQEYKQMRYNRLLENVLRGVDTYWLSEPLRVGLNQRHNIYAEGGNEQLRYGLGVNYNRIEGVMKQSSRETMSGNLDLLYRVGVLTFSNKLTVDVANSANPIVPFSEYARANPYYPKRNEGGTVEKWLERPQKDDSTTDAFVYMPNPLWNDDLDSYDRGSSFGVRNNFNIEYRPYEFLYIRARLGVEKTTSDTESFLSPEDTSFDQTELLKKGSYNDNRTDGFSYSGDLTATYGQYIADKHQINAVLGSSIQENKSISKGFGAVGFPEGNFTTPGFSSQYTPEGKPSYGDYKSRSVSFFFNGGYSYKNRYLLDANIRMDGTSVFGSNKLFTTTWAVGVAWNIHNESFIKDHTSAFEMLKIRASIGNPGNQSFGSYNTITTYEYNNWMQNNFGTGILVSQFGDPDLEWQKTLDFNIGFDLSIWKRFHINFNYYYKNTDPLLASIGIPLSVGMSSRLTNIGRQVNKGVNGTIRYALLYNPKERTNWTISLSFRNNKAYYDKIGENLDQYNKENISKNLTRYYDGGSPTALWTVRSAGIDPATGKEIFISKKGNPTFSYNYDDEVVVGDSNPKVEGVFGNSLYWKGLSFSFYIRYSMGAKAFNTTLYNKVENISSEDLVYNQDRRALYDRWQKPGDIARYKGISITDSTPISSRFVQPNNFVTLESMRLAYEMPRAWMERIHFSGMTLSAYMNDICRFSTIKEERGISYPFARSISFAISMNF